MPRNQSTVHFLKDLRDRLEMASSYATSHAEKAQQRYVERCNRRSCSKSLTVGEPVLVLQKDTTSSKVFSTWIGPAVVVEVQSLILMSLSLMMDQDGSSMLTTCVSFM